MTTRLPALALALVALAVAWLLAGHIARADAPGAVAALPSPAADTYAWLPAAWDGSIGLPYDPAEGWTQTQGPHTALYAGTPDVAIDFAPPGSPTCPGAPPSPYPVRAVLPGVVDDTGPGYVSLRVAQDGTAVMYYHIEGGGKVATGTRVEAGAPLGYVGCTYGMTTGPHLHIAMARGGEWLPVPEGWAE